MFIYKLEIQYNGAQYKGFQFQPSVETITGTILETLKRLIPNDPNLHVFGSSRTDAGVHALMQVARLKLSHEIPTGNLLRMLNRHLPNAIQVKDCVLADEKFNPMKWAKWKEYRYYFCLSSNKNPHLADYVTYIAAKEFDIEKIRQGLNLLVGQHDFSNFYCKGTNYKSLKRKIYKAELKEEQFKILGQKENVFYVQIIGNGFLKQMVRLIVGGLFALATHKKGLKDFKMALNDPNYGKIAKVASPEGLILYKMGQEELSFDI